MDLDVRRLIPRADELISIDVDPSDRPAWLEERRKGIGGSEIAAICGLSRRSTPLSVYRSKRGEEPDASNWQMRLGAHNEGLIAEVWSESEDPSPIVHQVPMLADRRCQWRRANLDRIAEYVSGDAEVIEIKWSRPWDEIPPQYLIQVTWYMAITGIHAGALVRGCDRSEPERIEVRWDPDLAAELEQIADRFWTDNVLAGVPPEPQSDAERAAHAYDLISRTSRSVEVGQDDPITGIVARIRAASEAAALAEREGEAAKLELAEAMAGCGADAVLTPAFRACLIRSKGSISYKAAAEEMGIAADVLERHRGADRRYLRIYDRRR